jgi:hypothetical protein
VAAALVGQQRRRERAGRVVANLDADDKDIGAWIKLQAAGTATSA